MGGNRDNAMTNMRLPYRIVLTVRVMQISLFWFVTNLARGHMQRRQW
jgi:p-aminobenzoyl-glutamate transporter AbgT